MTRGAKNTLVGDALQTPRMFPAPRHVTDSRREPQAPEGRGKGVAKGTNHHPREALE